MHTTFPKCRPQKPRAVFATSALLMSSSSSTTSSKKHDGDRDVEANHARAKFTSHDLANATLLVLLCNVGW